MKVSPKQEASFADSFIEIPPIELDSFQSMVDWHEVIRILNIV